MDRGKEIERERGKRGEKRCGGNCEVINTRRQLYPSTIRLVEPPVEPPPLMTTRNASRSLRKRGYDDGKRKKRAANERGLVGSPTEGKRDAIRQTVRGTERRRKARPSSIRLAITCPSRALSMFNRISALLNCAESSTKRSKIAHRIDLCSSKFSRKEKENNTRYLSEIVRSRDRDPPRLSEARRKECTLRFAITTH